MPLPTISAGGPGGMLYCEYVDSVSGERNAIRCYVAPFNPAASGAEGDHSYTGFGSFPPTESGVLATFAAFGAVWAPYYPNTWVLTLVAVAVNDGGVLTILPTVPTATPIVGVGTATEPPGSSVKRRIKLRSPADNTREFVLDHMPGTVVDIGAPVTPTVGGLDARDRAFMAYVSGPNTALRSASGAKFRPDGSVLVWWSNRRAAPVVPSAGTRDQFIGPTPPDLPQDGWLWVDTGLHGPPYQLKAHDAALGGWVAVGLSLDVDATGITGDGHLAAACLTFPLGATICNDAPNILHFNTPDGHHGMDASAIILTGGHRLERAAG